MLSVKKTDEAFLKWGGFHAYPKAPHVSPADHPMHLSLAEISSRLSAHNPPYSATVDWEEQLERLQMRQQLSLRKEAEFA